VNAPSPCGRVPTAQWNFLRGNALLGMTRTPQERAERLLRQKQEGTIAMSEYEKGEQARRLLTEKLRQERLARDAQVAQAAEAADTKPARKQA